MAQYVFTDIHGCYKEFMVILNKIELQQNDQLIFLGDYIDRGPDSFKVVEKVIELQNNYDTVTLLGNHEDMMLSNYRLWIVNGGNATIRSYEKELNTEFYLPTTHESFFKGLELFYETEDYIFVHAGYNKHFLIKEYIIWIRAEFYLQKPRSDGKTVIFGHTPFRRPFQEEGRIGIDTGCCYGGYLTCMKINNNSITFITSKD